MENQTENLQEQLPQREWYIASCVPNKEKQVAELLRGLSKSNHMKDYIFRVFVASYKEIDQKGKEKEKLLYKGKLFIEMVRTTYSYAEMRVTDFGFLLPAKDPTAISEEEIRGIYEACGKPYYPYEEYIQLVKEGKISE